MIFNRSEQINIKDVESGDVKKEIEPEYWPEKDFTEQDSNLLDRAFQYHYNRLFSAGGDVDNEISENAVSILNHLLSYWEVIQPGIIKQKKKEYELTSIIDYSFNKYVDEHKQNDEWQLLLSHAYQLKLIYPDKYKNEYEHIIDERWTDLKDFFIELLKDDRLEIALNELLKVKMLKPEKFDSFLREIKINEHVNKIEGFMSGFRALEPEDVLDWDRHFELCTNYKLIFQNDMRLKENEWQGIKKQYEIEKGLDSDDSARFTLARICKLMTIMAAGKAEINDQGGIELQKEPDEIDLKEEIKKPPEVKKY